MTQDIDKDVLRMAREAGFAVEDIPADPRHLSALLKADKWRWAIDRELVCAHLGVANPDGDPVKLLSELIQWHVDVALDPRVSSAARKLQEDAATQERQACAAMCTAAMEQSTQTQAQLHKSGDTLGGLVAAGAVEQARKLAAAMLSRQGEQEPS